MLSFARRIFSSTNANLLRGFYRTVDQINSIEKEIELLTDGELCSKTHEFRKRLDNGQSLEELLVSAFAVVREASKRVMSMRHFDVQLIGGIALHRGMIAEMKTGEGKTLVATLAAYLNAIEKKGVHIVTVNDYLAQRDSEWMGRLYKFLGITVGCITSSMTDDLKRKAYNCDIVYSTNNELGFDYLRDNMKFSRSEMVQRGLNYAIIDEVDSILIDEARTPLIISGQVDREVGIYQNIDKLIINLNLNDYILDEKSRAVFLTEEGISKIEGLLIENGLISPKSSLYDVENVIMMHYIDQALRAHKLFSINKDYIVKNGQVIIIDEFTGRMMDGRRYSDGLHQALEAKERVNINYENKTLASITFQNYFRMYSKLSGMTGTASTESDEFWGIYKLYVMQIPTNVKVIRKDLDDEIYATEEEKYESVIDFIVECNKKLQPVLVGTISIEKSEILSKLLTKKSLKHSVLNARYHEQEAHIIAQAGIPGMITIATNMAGRGTDIQLGGNLELLLESKLKDIIDLNQKDSISRRLMEEVKRDKERVVASGGLCVIATERHESRRIDNQLRGRSGRQGDPGLSKFFLSLEDDLLRVFGSDKIKTMLRRLGLKRNEAIKHSWINRAIERAQSKVEAKNYDIRKSLLKFDDVINEQRKVVFENRNQILDSVEYDLYYIYEDLNISIVNKAILGKYYGVNANNCNKELLADECARIYGIDIDMMTIDSFDEKNDVIKYLNKKVGHLIGEKKNELNQNNEDLFHTMVKKIMLSILDNLWCDHIAVLDALKHGINLRAVGQKDPLNEFKREAFIALQFMLSKFQELVMQKTLSISLDDILSYLNTEHEVKASDPYDRKLLFGKVSRNTSCPCGSKKKYKYCHGVL